MTGQQSAVMWMGVLLIVVRLFTTQQFRDLKAIFGWADTNKNQKGPPVDPLGPTPLKRIEHVVSPGNIAKVAIESIPVPGLGTLGGYLSGGKHS